MNQSRIMVLLLASTFLFAESCKKKEDDNTDVTFTNQLSEKVTLDIYSSADDYAKGNNLVLRKVLSAKENTILPGSTFAAGSSYYMDWYSDGMQYNNWFNDKFPVGGSTVAFKPVPGSNTYYMKTEFANHARATFLPGNAVSSKWTAVNVYAYSKTTGYISYWQNLSPQEKYREVTVNKNFTATYNHQNTDGKIVTDVIDFKVHASTEGYIELMDANMQSLGSMVTGNLPASDGSEYTSTSVDSVMALFPDSDYSFLMVKSQ